MGCICKKAEPEPSNLDVGAQPPVEQTGNKEENMEGVAEVAKEGIQVILNLMQNNFLESRIKSE